MKTSICLSVVLLIASAFPAPALAGSGDQHPHRRLSISGECTECDFSGQNLSGAVIVGAHFTQTNFSDAEMPGAQLRECRFTHSDFTDASMPGSRLSGVDFSDSDFEDAVLVEVQGERVGFVRASLREADLSSSRFVVVDFRDADLTEAIFAGSQLYQARFIDAVIDRAVFRGASLQRANFTDSHGRATQFTGADLRGAIFRDAYLRRADFNGAQLDYVDFSGADLKGVRGLRQEQLANSCGNDETELPGNLNLPTCESVRSRGGTSWVFAPAPRGRPSTVINVDHLRIANEHVVEELQRALSTADGEGMQRALDAAIARAESLGIDVEIMTEEFHGNLRDTMEARREAQEAARDIARESMREAEHEARDAARRAGREQAEAARRAAHEQREMQRREHVLSHGENEPGLGRNEFRIFNGQDGAEFRWRMDVEMNGPASIDRIRQPDPAPNPPLQPLAIETERKGPAPDFESLRGRNRHGDHDDD